MSEPLFNASSLSVLVVDDHAPIRKGVRRVLQGMGFGEIVECFDGDDAIKYIEQRPFDLLIVDLIMRNIGGFEVIDYVRGRDIGCDLPIIVVTGEASKEEIVKVADRGAEDYLLKPFQAHDLERKVIKTLNSYYSPTPLLKALRKAERLFMTSSYSDALIGFDAALRLDGSSARATHGKALTLEKLQRTDEAIHLLQDSIRSNPSYHRNHGVLADILLKQNKLSEALESMRRELEINPKQPERQVYLANLLLKQGDTTGAVDHFRIALQEEPKHQRALMGMGHAYSMAENLEKALYYFKRVRRYHPTATEALEAAVRTCLAAKEPKRAELLLKDEKSAHPDRHDAYVLLANLYLKQDRETEAMELAEGLLEHEPLNTMALKIKATAFLKKNDHQSAYEALSTVARLAPSAEALVTLGETLLVLRKVPDAMEALSRAISMDGENPQAFYLLAEALKRQEQWLKAVHLYKRAAQLGAPSGRCAADIAFCRDQAGKRRNRPRAAS